MSPIETRLEPGEQAHGFVVKAVTPVRELRAVAYQLEHMHTGARLLHLYADDPENLFSISFPTPPPDDTGVPHVLEHAVLSGSRKFPLRDPFFEMLKMSMATFLNAMTGEDCTYYPVASNVKQDLFNLAEVYFDAVFHPLLTEQTFKREGHHLAPARKDDPAGDLTTNGIVYSEMKGALSNPESRLYRCAGRGLFPDTVYGRESGGDPEHIPHLTYAGLKSFHHTYYHPSNAYFFIYGNTPTQQYLAFLEDKFVAFERRDVHPAIARQPRWQEPRTLTDSYPIGADEPDENKTYVQLDWLVGDATDASDVARLYTLSQILLGHEAAPLRKAIIDSNLGQDMLPSGYDSVGLETVFRVGLKGTEPGRADAFVKLVLDTLAHVAQGSIEAHVVEAALQQAAYHYLEIMPLLPLHAMGRALGTWIYNADPLTFLRMGEHLAQCRDSYQADPQVFNRLIRERLLDNAHRLTVVLEPDRGWQARTDAAFAQRMQQVRAQLTEHELNRIAADAAELERDSSKPNPPEALAKLPQLSISDLPARPKHIPTAVEHLRSGVDLLRNDVFANSVSYLHLDFNLDGLPEDMWAYLPRYADAIGKLGAAGMGYEQIARRVAASTGGIGCLPYFMGHAVDAARPLRGLRLVLKTLDDQIEPALGVLHDLLFGLDPRDADRLRNVLAQAQARYHNELVYHGSWTAALHAARGLSPAGHLSEVCHGLPQLSLTDRLCEGFDRTNSELMDKVEAIRDFLLARGRLTVSFTGSDQAYKAVRDSLVAWVDAMRDEPVRDGPVGFVPYEVPPREGLAGPIQVAHCAEVMPAPHYSEPDAPLVALGAHLIGFEHMLSEIRLKGGAYGAWCRYDSLDGRLELGSFRDPHVAGTLQVFAGVMDYVRQADWTQTEVARAIIATAKGDEKPIRPGDATGLALHRYITGQTPELREQRHARIVSATAKEVKRATIEALDANLAQGAVCVVSSREKLEEANRQMPDRALAIEDILK